MLLLDALAALLDEALLALHARRRAHSPDRREDRRAPPAPEPGSLSASASEA
jgi:hypothetical protein